MKIARRSPGKRRAAAMRGKIPWQRYFPGNKTAQSPSTSAKADTAAAGPPTQTAVKKAGNERPGYQAMRKAKAQGAYVLAFAIGAVTAIAGTNAGAGAGSSIESMSREDAARTVQAGVTLPGNTAQATQLASRDMAELYSRVYRLIGSYVLNLDGERIGQVNNLILDDQGNVKKVLIGLYDAFDADHGLIAVSSHRAEVISAEGSRVTVIRVDLTREELFQAQLVRLKTDARAPAQRAAGLPVMHPDADPLY